MTIRFVTEHPETRRKVNEFVEEWNSPSQEICVHTSGSTGKPKEIRIQKEHMIASALATGKFLGLSAGDTALLCLSMDTIGGRMMIVRSIVLDLELIVSDVSSTPLQSVNQPIDFAAMVPMQVQKSLEETPAAMQKINKLIIGGGPVSESLLDQLQSIPTKAYHTFGMTETISHIAMRSLNHPLQEEFHCLPGIKIEEHQGSLVINAPTIGVDSLETNDAIEMVSETSFRWLGRTDFVINSGGVKLHPEQIESQLSKLLPLPFFVYGEVDDTFGERLILAVESAKPLNLTKASFEAVLSKYSIPKEIRYIKEFSYTSSGKINRLKSKIRPHVAHEIL
ncbi:MAG: AMP-binding protein [Flavobacteriales bacterium]|nr:AMP-binding protein [Flavobacteriales bacterium]